MHLTIRNGKGSLITQVRMRKTIKDWLTGNGKSQSLRVCAHVILCFSDMYLHCSEMIDNKAVRKLLILKMRMTLYMSHQWVLSRLINTLIMANNSSQGNSSYLAIKPKCRSYFSLSNFGSVLILFRCFPFTIPSAYNFSFEGLFFFLSPFYTMNNTS